VTTTEGGVCANIGPRERRKRNIVGVAGALVTVLTAAALIDSHASPLLRLVVVVPGMLAAMGFLQARAQTCVALAKQGIRVLGDEVERVDDRMSKAIAAQARRVWLQASAAVAALTLLVMVIP